MCMVWCIRVYTCACMVCVCVSISSYWGRLLYRAATDKQTGSTVTSTYLYICICVYGYVMLCMLVHVYVCIVCMCLYLYTWGRPFKRAAADRGTESIRLGSTYLYICMHGMVYTCVFACVYVVCVYTFWGGSIVLPLPGRHGSDNKIDRVRVQPHSF